MESIDTCLCCLLRPPDKDFSTPYSHLGKMEIYSDMLEYCFQIQLPQGNEHGICEDCVKQLRDASVFKLQVECSLARLQTRLRMEPLLADDALNYPIEISDDSSSEKDDGAVKKETNSEAETHDEWLYEATIVKSEVDIVEEPYNRKLPVQCDETILKKEEDSQDGAHKPVGDALPARGPAASGARRQLAMTCRVPLERLPRAVRTPSPPDTHTKDKPYCCYLCNKPFSEISDLVSHMDTHTGQKPYSCHICFKTFSINSHLLLHTKTHEVPIEHVIEKYDCGDINDFNSKWEQNSHSYNDYELNACDEVIEHSSNASSVSDEENKGNVLELKENTFTCDICNKQLLNKGLLVIHRRTHTQSQVASSKYRAKNRIELKRRICIICKKQFKNRFSLSSHMKVHKEETTYSCEICNEAFRRESDLRRHELSHTQERLFGCCKCNKTYGNKVELTRHMQIHSMKSYTCDICKEQFNSESDLTLHIQTHFNSCEKKPSTNMYDCDICEKQFAYNSSLIIHMRMHTGEKPYACKVCNKKFTQRGHLKRHKIIHAKERLTDTGNTYTCDICKKNFREYAYIVRHMATHMANLHACETCDKKFGTIGQLNKHVKIHEKRRFSCKVCNKQFVFGSELKRHERIHTGEYYTCDVCKKQFNMKSDLVVHVRMHTGEKPYACKVCNKAFSSSSHLRRHEKNHIRKSGGGCSRCRRCGKVFPSLIELNKHKRIHGNIYICDICKNVYWRKDYLIKHIRAHPDGKPYSCKGCDKKFIAEIHLKRHEKKYKSEGIFSCQKSITLMNIIEGDMESV